MHKAQVQVREFMRDVIGKETSPMAPALRDAELRARLILEEATETAAALVGGERAREITGEFTDKHRARGPSIVEAVDGLCDLIYVAYGTAEAVGIDLEPYFDVVHASNMSKTRDAVDGHGKCGGKPPEWVAPDGKIRAMLLDEAAVWDAGEEANKRISESAGGLP